MSSTSSGRMIPNNKNSNNNNNDYRAIFLSLLGFLFFLAFFSYTVQYTGLLSSSGIAPVERALPHVFPHLHRAIMNYSSSAAAGGGAEAIIIDTLFGSIVPVVGMSLSLAIGCALVQPNGLFYLILTALYYSLVAVGQNFYSFQWDVLLLETGFVTSICYASWRWTQPPSPSPSPSSSSSCDDDNSNNKNNNHSCDSQIGTWSLRFLLFKLMLMSGVVKLQASCPTWKHLTALEYHFATQCLPSPLSWIAHQFHPLLLRLSVAITLWIEIAAPFLLLVPVRATRIFAAKTQVALQVMILLTGNYNFFNLLTVALCLPAMEDDGWWPSPPKMTDNGDKSRPRANGAWGTVVRLEEGLRALCTWGFIIWSWTKMFRFYSHNDDGDDNDHRAMGISLVLTDDQLTEVVVDKGIPCAIAFTSLVVLAAFAKRIMNSGAGREGGSSTFRNFAPLIRGPICSIGILVISYPLLTLSPQLQRHATASYYGAVLHSHIYPIYTSLQPYHVVNGYGLFRRMTGVAPNNEHAGNLTNVGWGGLPPSIVARPEIILEGMFANPNNGTGEWKELIFRWKPGPVAAMPKQVAPHQPRLDWQMWFAALGHYQHNPWLIVLMDKILEGCSPVIGLLDDPNLNAGHRPTAIRAVLYHYDFTRLNTAWNRRIPNVSFVDEKNKNRNDGAEGSFVSRMLQLPEVYWYRTKVGDYTMAIEANNTSVTSFLQHHGYKKYCSD